MGYDISKLGISRPFVLPGSQTIDYLLFVSLYKFGAMNAYIFESV